MPFSRIVRIGVGMSAAVGALALVAWVLIAADGSDGISHSTAAVAFGWAIPFVTGAFIGLAVWGLLTGRRAESSAEDPLSPHCPVCSASVRSDWRLCPSCGSRLSGVFADSPDAVRARD